MRRLCTFQVPEHITEFIVDSLKQDQEQIEAKRSQEVDAIKQQITELEARKRQAYKDKVDRVINEEFWRSMYDAWSAEEARATPAARG